MSTDNRPMQDRRKEPRFQANGIGDLAILNPPSLDRLTVTVVDVSRSGCQIELQTPVDEGVMIELHLKEVIVMGVIVNCRPHDEGRYRAGIQTTKVTESPLRTRHLPESDFELYALGNSLSEAQRELYVGHLELCEQCRHRLSKVDDVRRRSALAGE